MINLTIEKARGAVKEKLMRYFAVLPEEADPDQMYKALALCVRDILISQKNDFNKRARAKGAKRVYYLCMEFLLGRSLKNNLCNLRLESTFRKALKEDGYDLDALYDLEADPGLGNGGLGRLAACYMDALASQNYPATGFSLLYEYGLFRQKIVDGQQVEMPDVWLDTGEMWMVPRSDKTYKVRLDGRVEETWEDGRLISIRHVGGTLLEAYPYDMMLSGEGGEAVSILRLWRARNAENFNMSQFSQGDYAEALRADAEAEAITKVLYPADDHNAGKSLRISQQYFLVSASLQNIIGDHLKYYKDIETLADKTAIHINDTHPALCIPEMMRLLMDEHGFSWEKAWDFTTRMTAYTNHTILAEALEKWSDELIRRKLPRLYSIINEINNRFMAEVWNRFPGDLGRQERMAILSGGQVRMANLSVVGSRRVNGVSALHSEIIKKSVFHDFYVMTPEKFTNVTNGIAYRRWLCQSNPRLDRLIKSSVGDQYVYNPEKLKDLLNFEKDAGFLSELAEIKLANKKDFSDYIFREQGVRIDPETRFDTQIKRLHEYKRQLLNAMKIISIYLGIKDDPNKAVAPQTFIFGAKAAPGYYHAKRIIELLNNLATHIRKDKQMKGRLDVLFVENYNVTKAEKLIPASEVSQQISLAGKEASGTSNMKFMLNGAVTLGTMDGANVEIYESVGKDNIFIFGLSAAAAADLWKSGYYATSYYASDPRVRRVIEALKTGFNGEKFTDIADYLIANRVFSDPYMNLADFDSYLAAHEKMSVAYADAEGWNRKALINIAESGRFAADRSIKEYAENIWGLEPVN